MFFFFQAEDGIRDPLVTRVQTCALPILPPAPRHPVAAPPRSASGSPGPSARGKRPPLPGWRPAPAGSAGPDPSRPVARDPSPPRPPPVDTAGLLWFAGLLYDRRYPLGTDNWAGARDER